MSDASLIQNERRALFTKMWQSRQTH